MIAKLQPNRVRRTYLGGGRIEAFTGERRSEVDGVTCPEDWLASTTVAFNGVEEIAGEGLGRLEDGRFVKDVMGDIPVLVKLLDSDERLVIQAHPTVPCAKRLFGSPVGKTECWYFLPGTSDDACVYLGFKPGITRELWRDAVLSQKGLLDMLHRIPVKAGDFVFVDGGVPHAIGGGCFIVELQEPSDLMVVAERSTPSGRRIPDAKIHGGVGWEKMFDVYGYGGLSFEETCRRYVRLRSPIRCDSSGGSPADGGAARICGPDLTDKFEFWRMAGGGRIRLKGACAVVVAIDGAGSINGTKAVRGDRFVVSEEDELSASGNVELVLCFKANTDADGCARLR